MQKINASVFFSHISTFQNYFRSYILISYLATADRDVEELINFIPSSYKTLLFSFLSKASLSIVNSCNGGGIGDATTSSTCFI